LVGSALTRALAERGDEVLRLVRRAPHGPRERRWDPVGMSIDADALEVDAVVHLAGEGIAEGRWSPARMQRIRDSRVQGTKLVAGAVGSALRAPRVLVSASAIGYYGDRGAEVLDETSAAGAGFLAEVCEAWEGAADAAREAGVRVVHPRIGVVLAREGGALTKMLLPFRLGVGGRVGSGRQMMSWIALGDLVRLILHALDDDGLAGPVNAVAPGAVSNAEFTRALGRALHRPTILPMPAFGARLAFGKMADHLLLASTHVVPRAAEASGFRFEHTDIDEALAAVLSS
jgi:hypothetical protein